MAENPLSFLNTELDAQNAKLSILFIGGHHKLDSLQSNIEKELGKNVIACTTAGEIGLKGYDAGSMSGISFSGPQFETSTIDIPDLGDFTETAAKNVREKTLQALDLHKASIPEGRTFAILLIDGLTMNEESTTGLLSHALPVEVSLVGGSAGDGLNFEETFVYYDGKFKKNRGLIALVTTSVPFEVFKSQHFSQSNNKMVITEADPKNRVVKEIDGEPAAVAYARHLNVPIPEFGPQIYSKHPVMLNIGGQNYVRSIQKVNPDNSLTFYCAIEEGLVLTLANREPIIENIASLFEGLKEKLGPLDLTLTFECILRRLEVLDLSDSEKKDIMDLFSQNNTIGFHTYGEQFGGIHVNQTITGIAFGHE